MGPLIETLMVGRVSARTLVTKPTIAEAIRQIVAGRVLSGKSATIFQFFQCLVGHALTRINALSG